MRVIDGIVMEELRQQIEGLQARVEQKDLELRAIREELTLLQARLEDVISQEKIQIEQEAAMAEAAKAKSEEEAKQREIEARAQAEAEQKRKEAEAEQLRQEAEAAAKIETAKQLEEEAHIDSTVDELKLQHPESEEIKVEQIGEAEHEAIMRTIEEMSRSLGISKHETAEGRFATKPTLGDRVSRQKLNDIKRGIGINERFLFANELFNGDMNAFSRAVEELNHVESELDANRLLDQDFSAKYRWDEESETVVAFKSLVSRRFAQ